MPAWSQPRFTNQIEQRSSSIVKVSNSKKYQRAYPSSRSQLGRRGHMPGPPAFAVMSLSCFLADLAEQHTRRMCMEQGTKSTRSWLSFGRSCLIWQLHALRHMHAFYQEIQM